MFKKLNMLPAVLLAYILLLEPGCNVLWETVIARDYKFIRYLTCATGP